MATSSSANASAVDNSRGNPKTHKLTDQTNILPLRQVIAVFFGLALCVVVSSIDSVIVSTALPTISSSFNAGAIVSWVPSAFLLTSTTFQPLWGRFSDIFGRKAVLCVAMSIFIVGNFAAGFARSIQELIICRGIAGAGGGALISLCQIVMADVVSLRDREISREITFTMTLGYLIGPVLGGKLSEDLSWRLCFWVTLPLAIIAILVVLVILPLKPVKGDIRQKLLAIDYVGVLLTLVGCALLILPLIWGGVTFPWASGPVLGTLISGVIIIGVFCVWEWKGAGLPIVPMYIFKNPTVVGVYIAMFINGFVFNSSLFYLPQFFQAALGYPPAHSGILMFPFLASQTMCSFLTGVIVSLTGTYRPLIYSGFTLWAIGLARLSTVTRTSSQVLVIVSMALSGIGAGQTTQTTTVAAQASVSRQEMSVVTAIRNFVRLFGGTLSIAVGSAIVNNSLRGLMSALHLDPAAISAIVEDPSLLVTFMQSSHPAADQHGITPAMAKYIIDHGYIKGFKILFILNACLTALAAFSSGMLIRHTELTRCDEQQPQNGARQNNVQPAP